MKIETRENIQQLYHGLSNILKGTSFFTCVYGSTITDHCNERSDIDFFVATQNVDFRTIKSLSDYAEKFHRDRGLGVDEEVPYTNKVAVSYSDLSAATRLRGLQISDGRLIVPPIIKSDDFLNSRSVRLRLLFNALTAPHDIDQVKLEYVSAKSEAEHTLFLLAVDLADQRGLNPGIINNLIDVLLSDGHGNEGEMYLGYKPYDQVVQHLEEVLKMQLNQHNLSETLLIQAVLASITNLFNED